MKHGALIIGDGLVEIQAALNWVSSAETTKIAKGKTDFEELFLRLSRLKKRWARW